MLGVLDFYNELLDSVEKSHEYDDNGSLIAEYGSDGSLERTFEYNAENRMSAVRDENDDLIAEYLYDPFGRRVRKTAYEPAGASPDTTWYVYSDQGLMAELDEIGNSSDFYMFPLGEFWSTDPIIRKSGASYFYYQTDHLGTPQKLINNMGSVVHTREMRAFGEAQQTGIEDRWRLPGQFRGTMKGLSYNFMRYYRSATGRYISADSIGVSGGINLYLYAEAKPSVQFDPQGLRGVGLSNMDSPLPTICRGLQCICEFFPSWCGPSRACVKCEEPEFSLCLGAAGLAKDCVKCTITKKKACFHCGAGILNAAACVGRYCTSNEKNCNCEND